MPDPPAIIIQPPIWMIAQQTIAALTSQEEEN